MRTSQAPSRSEDQGHKRGESSKDEDMSSGKETLGPPKRKRTKGPEPEPEPAPERSPGDKVREREETEKMQKTVAGASTLVSEKVVRIEANSTKKTQV